MATDDRGIGSDRRAAPDSRLFEFILARNVCTRIDDVGKDAARTTKNIVVEHHAFIQADVVLDLATVADAHLWPDHDVLSDRAVATDRDVGEHVAEMPDRRALPDGDRIVDVAAFMHAHAGKTRIVAELAVQ